MEINQALQDLSAYEAVYSPSDEVAERLRSITLAAFIGPAAVGKTTCIEQVAQLDDQFGRVRPFATRPRRPGESDNEYRFLDQADPYLSRIARMAIIRKGGLVQYGVHPTTGHVYGSEISDYDHPYMMLPVQSHNIETIRRLPFNKMVELAIVTEPEEWVRRLHERGLDPHESRKRALEGKQSLEWSLDQGEDITWVCTPTGIKPETTLEIRDLIKGTRKPNYLNRQIGQNLLKEISHYV